MLVLWVRGHPRGECLERVDADGRLVVNNRDGWLEVRRFDGPFQAGRVPPEVWRRWHFDGDAGYMLQQSGGRWWNDLGFNYSSRQVDFDGLNLHDWLQGPWSGRETFVTVPYLPVAFALAYLSLGSFAFWRVRGRSRST